MIKGKYLQAYLDEFCYKLNRRYFGEKLFDMIVTQGWTLRELNHHSTTLEDVYTKITGGVQ